MDFIKKNLPLLLIILFSLPVVLPLIQPGYFPMHDDTQPTRIYEMAQALGDGQFPVRWVSDLGYGYGYPLFNFYAPLPYYFGAAGVRAGLDAIASAKLMLATGILLAGVTMYTLGRSLWGTAGGFIAALLYIYAPYHAVQLYVRGAAGELWAYAFLPLVFYGVGKWSTDRWLKGVLVSGGGFAAVLLSHNISGLITFGFLSLWLAVSLFKYIRTKKVRVIAVPFLVIVLGLSLSAFFWLPALVEAPDTRAHTLIEGSNNFRDHFVYANQLWDSPWGYAGSASGQADGMSFKLGKLNLLLAIAGMTAVWFTRTSRRTRQARLTIDLLVGLGIALFMLLPLSQPVWEAVPFAPFIQYPWRFLTWVLFFLSLMAGGVGTYPYRPPVLQKGVFSALILLVIFVNGKYFRPQLVYEKNQTEYTSDRAIKWNISRISDEYLPLDFPIPQSETEVSPAKVRATGDIMIEQSDISSHRWDVTVTAAERAEIVFSIAAISGWRTFVDSREVAPVVKRGLLTLTIPAGRHHLKAYFSDTAARSVGNTISLTAATVLLVLITRMRHTKKV